MLEGTMVRHGAPTLAGLKTGSLFSVQGESQEKIEQERKRINQVLQPKGLHLVVMKQGNKRTLLYLYREEKLRQCLQCEQAQALLRACGYQQFSVAQALKVLQKRLNLQDSFPHEIGLFLGYPLPDVAGFMRHRGKNCLLCGCWKVYGEEAQALQTFAQYRKCTDAYSKRFHTGCSLAKLTVAAKTA